MASAVAIGLVAATAAVAPSGVWLSPALVQPPREPGAFDPLTDVTPNPGVVTFSATDARAIARAGLSALHRREIRAVLAASDARDRERLYVSLPFGTDRDGIVLYYGVPGWPSGLIPSSVLNDRPANDTNGKPILIAMRYDPIGGPCETYMPSTGGFNGSTGAGCDTHSRAWYAAYPYGLPRGRMGP